MPRYLVVADETVGGKPLLDEIRLRHEGNRSQFTVLVPATVPTEGLTWTESEARGLARDRLERVLNRLRELGVEADGDVADPDPYLAVEDTIRGQRFDEVILSAPSKRSGWMKPDLPKKMEGAFRLPVVYVAGEREEEVRVTALMRTKILGGLSGRHLRAFAKATMVESFRPGATIVEEGSVGSDLYMIIDGRVKVLMGGRAVDRLSVGEAFGEASVLASGSRTTSVVAESPTRCLRLPGKELLAAMAGDPEVAARVLEATGIRLRELSRGFRDIMSSLALDADLLERLAEEIHVEYCAEELAKGSKWGEPADDYLLRHESLASYAGRGGDGGKAMPNLVAYENLPEQVKEQNRDLVREIPKRLAAAAYVMRPLAPGEVPTKFSDQEIEVLAEREHDRWVRLKLAQGWSFASARDDNARHHPSLVPWGDLSPEERQSRFGMDGASKIGAGALSEEEKDKDRALTRTFGAILGRVGYTAVKLEPPIE